MKYIVVSQENNRPMAFEDGQFCYVPSFKTSSKRVKFPFPLVAYTRERALYLIRRHTMSRKKWGMTPTPLCIMPILK